MYKEKLKSLITNLFLGALEYKFENDIHRLQNSVSITRAIRMIYSGKSINEKGEVIFYREHFEGRDRLEKALGEVRLF